MVWFVSISQCHKTFYLNSLNVCLNDEIEMSHKQDLYTAAS